MPAGPNAPRPPGGSAGDAGAWVASGAASLTGWPDGPGLVPPAGVLERIRRLGRAAGVDAHDAFATLTERAAVTGLRRRGDVSCGGATRLVRAGDGWMAISLARTDDVAAVAAWLELDADPGPDPWPAITATLPSRGAAELVDRATMLGLPVARVPQVGQVDSGDSVDSGESGEGLPGRWHRLCSAGRAPRAVPVVVDLSSLWAGPVCARVLAAGGAAVVKVESIRRPDGARQGPGVFFDRLHAGHRAVALDFDTAAGREALRALVMAADVVIEASRPRALAQLDVRPDDLGPAGPSVWVSITGHGREVPAGNRVAFGDDAAAGAGLVAPTARGPVFVADAIADPLTGLAAAAAASRALRGGGRWLVDVSLSGVAAWVAARGAAGNAGETSAWTEVDDPPSPPPVEAPLAPAPALGAHTAEVLAALRAVPA